MPYGDKMYGKNKLVKVYRDASEGRVVLSSRAVTAMLI